MTRGSLPLTQAGDPGAPPACCGSRAAEQDLAGAEAQVPFADVAHDAPVSTVRRHRRRSLLPAPLLADADEAGALIARTRKAEQVRRAGTVAPSVPQSSLQSVRGPYDMETDRRSRRGRVGVILLDARASVVLGGRHRRTEEPGSWTPEATSKVKATLALDQRRRSSRLPAAVLATRRLLPRHRKGAPHRGLRSRGPSRHEGRRSDYCCHCSSWHAVLRRARRQGQAHLAPFASGSSSRARRRRRAPPDPSSTACSTDPCSLVAVTMDPARSPRRDHADAAGTHQHHRDATRTQPARRRRPGRSRLRRRGSPGRDPDDDAQEIPAPEHAHLHGGSRPLALLGSLRRARPPAPEHAIGESEGHA